MRTDGSQQKISGSERGSEPDPLSRNNHLGVKDRNIDLILSKNAFINQHDVLIYKRIFAFKGKRMNRCRSPPSI